MERLPVRQLSRQCSLYSHVQSSSYVSRHDRSVAIRYLSQGPRSHNQPKGFFARVLENIRSEWSQNKEIKESLEKFRQETQKLEETKALKQARVKYKQVEAESMNTQRTVESDEQELLKASARVVWGAVLINGANFLVKTIAWIYTGSHSMFAESVHSLADTANQLILAVGIRKSLQSPTADHPYGYHPMRYIAPLISGVGIFCVGCGLSIYHGVEALLTTKPELVISPNWVYGILIFSFLSESTTFLMAIRALRDGAAKSKLKVRDYISRNSDPGVIVVLLEDMAAVMGIGIAASCMALSSYYNTHIFDACGSLMIGSLLGGVATFIIRKNTVALVGKSIPLDTLNNINRIIEKDVLIRAIHDVKATDLGNGVVRYKAEVDVDGRELSKKYLERIDLKELLDEIKDFKSEKDVETFILTHGEGVVDLLGAEVDRIEKELRKSSQGETRRPGSSVIQGWLDHYELAFLLWVNLIVRSLDKRVIY